MDDNDNGRRVDMRVGDRLVLELRLHPVPGVTAGPGAPLDESVFEVLSQGDDGSVLTLHCRAVGVGKVPIEIKYMRGDGTLDPRTWSVLVAVKN